MILSGGTSSANGLNPLRPGDLDRCYLGHILLKTTVMRL